MSVLTYHEVSNEGKNIFDRLQKEGIIHEGRIYSPRSQKYFYFEHVFDYTKCDRKTKEEVESREKERDKLYIKSLKEFGQYTDEVMAKRIEENRKCDYHLMPVQRTAAGGVSWVLNYDWDDMPSVAIGRKYPDEDFEYFQETEGEVDLKHSFIGLPVHFVDALDTVVQGIHADVLHKGRAFLLTNDAKRLAQRAVLYELYLCIA